jgi:hypothetical protein
VQWTSDEDMFADEDTFADMESEGANIKKKAKVEGVRSAEKAEAEACDWAADLDSNNDGKAEVKRVRTELDIDKARVNIEDMDREEDLVRNLCRFLPLASLVSLHSASHRLGLVMDKVLKDDRIDSEIKRVVDVMGHIDGKVQSAIGNIDLHIEFFYAETVPDMNLDSDDPEDAEIIRSNEEYMGEQREFEDRVNKLGNDLEEIRGKIEDLQKPECKLTATAKMLVLKDLEDSIAGIKINFEDLKTRYNIVFCDDSQE